jgi:hypothetical protein
LLEAIVVVLVALVVAISGVIVSFLLGLALIEANWRPGVSVRRIA